MLDSMILKSLQPIYLRTWNHLWYNYIYIWYAFTTPLLLSAHLKHQGHTLLQRGLPKVYKTSKPTTATIAHFTWCLNMIQHVIQNCSSQNAPLQCHCLFCQHRIRCDWYAAWIKFHQKGGRWETIGEMQLWNMTGLSKAEGFPDEERPDLPPQAASAIPTDWQYPDHGLNRFNW